MRRRLRHLLTERKHPRHRAAGVEPAELQPRPAALHRRTARSGSSLFIPGIPTAGKTALATGDTYSASSDKAFITISPSSGALPPEGVTVTVTIDTSQLDIGSTQGSVTVIRTPAAGKVGALGNPPAPINVPVSVSVVAPVTPTPKDPNAPFNALLIPAIAHADGIGTRFVSDVRLTNTSAQSITYQLTYTPSNTDGTQSGKQTTITVAGGDTKALNDIVKDWYGSGVLGERAGLARDPAAELRRQGPGQHQPGHRRRQPHLQRHLARERSDSSSRRFRWQTSWPRATSRRSRCSRCRRATPREASARTSASWRAPAQPVNFVATLFDDGGTKLAERAYSLKPYESQQIKLDSFFNVNGVTCRTSPTAASR